MTDNTSIPRVIRSFRPYGWLSLDRSPAPIVGRMSPIADPQKCTARVRCANGLVTTESCITKAPLISNGESSDGERDYYICPDCRKDITINYREN